MQEFKITLDVLFLFSILNHIEQVENNMITKKQSQVLQFIDSYMTKFGFSPTYAEIAEHMGLASKSPVAKHIDALEAAGYVKKSAKNARGLTLLKPVASNDVVYPFVGKIAAGLPIEALENIEYIDFNQHFSGAGRRYLLQVSGDSMIEAGIFDSDWVLIEQCNTARNGEIVVALIEGYEATLKRYMKNPDQTVTLIPENRNMKPMVYHASQVLLQGKLVAQMRTYH